MKPRKMPRRMTPSTKAKSTVLVVCGAQWRSERAAAKGRNLYMKIKKPSESAILKAGNPAIHLQLFSALRLLVFQGHIRRIAQGLEAEHHGGAQGDNSANKRPPLPRALVAGLGERLGMNCQLPVRLADGNSPGVRGAHHDAFQNSLAADESLLGALQRERKLQGSVKAQMGTERHNVH